MNIEAVKQEVGKISSGFIGDRINKDTIDRFSAQLNDFIGANFGTVVKCGLAWSIMSLREKLLWWVSTIVFPSISKDLLKFMPSGKPIWLLEDPHSTIDAEIFLPKSAKGISLNMSACQSGSIDSKIVSDIQAKCLDNVAEWAKEDAEEDAKEFIERVKSCQ